MVTPPGSRAAGADVATGLSLLSPVDGFGLVTAPSVCAPASAVRDTAHLLHIDVAHVAGPSGMDLPRLAVGLAIGVDEPAPVDADLSQVPVHGLSQTDFVYVWADGVHPKVRLGQVHSCVLVLLGVRLDGTKELIALAEGLRESTESWADLLRDCRRRGMRDPESVIGDGAMGLWKALAEVFPAAGHQRCWVHEACNVTNYLPKSAQPGATKAMQEIYNAEDRTHARRRSRSSPAPTARSGPRPSRRSPTTRTNCWPSMTSRPSTGSTCGPPTPSSQPSPPSSSARRSPAGLAARPPPWRWCSSSLSPPRTDGGRSPAPTSSPWSGLAPGSGTASWSSVRRPHSQAGQLAKPPLLFRSCPLIHCPCGEHRKSTR
ncbi:hypothetical protein SUDANB108_03799 [Streptomyces sp. enrichment culture]